MPHKHTRRKDHDKSHFDLAPSVLAKPLPAYSNEKKPQKPRKQGGSKAHTKKNGGDLYKHDDTPRAFARMMHLQTNSKRQRSGLDEGEDRSIKKKRKANPSNPTSMNIAQAGDAETVERPKILPGERLGDFAARVDQAMPVGNLKRKGKIRVEGVRERQTNTEKRLHKMYAAWREEDAKLKEKMEEQKELEEEANAELGVETLALNSNGKRKQRTAKDDDPWHELGGKREGRSGLHDVVQAPPSFKVIPKEKFKIKNGARVVVENVPSTAGSLKRREELSEARREVIDRYRAMMGKKA